MEPNECNITMIFKCSSLEMKIMMHKMIIPSLKNKDQYKKKQKKKKHQYDFFDHTVQAYFTPKCNEWQRIVKSEFLFKLPIRFECFLFPFTPSTFFNILTPFIH